MDKAKGNKIKHGGEDEWGRVEWIGNMETSVVEKQLKNDRKRK